MAVNNAILDSASFRSQAAAVAAEPGAIAIQNILNELNSVDDQGVATALGGGGGGSGTVTSVAATALGLLAVAGTPTVAPTVGIASMAANTVIVNATAGAAVPTATKLPLAAMATQANSTVLGNGSGGALAPVALTVSGATGLVIDATTLKNSLITGLAGGQTVLGGTGAGDKLFLQSGGGATGLVIIGTQGIANAAAGLQYNDNTKTIVFGVNQSPIASSIVAQFHSVAQTSTTVMVSNASSNAAAAAGFLLANSVDLGSGNYANLSINGQSFTTSGLQKAGGLTLNLASGSGNLVLQHAGTGDVVIATAGATERMRLTTDAKLSFFAASAVVQQTVAAISYSIVDYATDAAIIKSSLSQLATALRNYGLGA